MLVEFPFHFLIFHFNDIRQAVGGREKGQFVDNTAICIFYPSAGERLDEVSLPELYNVVSLTEFISLDP
jgi:hypothetical protein